ncbi:MAG: META domain-containing protein [Halomonas subglaciescola]|nr:META domain-containing protein [Halomonas subglaciescola]
MKKIAGYSLLLGLTLAAAGCATQSPDGSSDGASDNTPDVALANTYWKLTELANGQVETVDNQREAHFVLHTDNQRVAGATGCNQLMGSYALDDQQIAFQQLGTTMMACQDGADTERAFLTALNQTDTWEIDGNTLTLSNDDAQPIAHFEAVALY